MKHNFTRILLIITVFCLFVTGCSTPMAKKSGTGNVIQAENAGKEYHEPSGKTQSVYSNSYIELLFDEESCNISVKDKKNSFTWNSLDGDNIFSYAFGITLCTPKGMYSLNTQDNSVALSGASFKKENGELEVTYILSDKAETIKKAPGELDENDVYASFSVSYRAMEQTVYLDADFSSCVTAPESYIADFTVMPCLGSRFADGESDYFLVPDGPGAVMKLSSQDVATSSIRSDIYGDDAYNYRQQPAASCCVPVYGVKRDTSAFACVITKGDALASIYAKRADENSFSMIYPVFTLTQTLVNEDNTVSRGAVYNGKISVAYKFLSGESADYISMAAAAREEFIKNGMMSSVMNNEEDIPFYLTIVGNDGSQNLTSTKQTLDILTILKGKGIGNITLTYKGMLSGGLEQKNAYSARMKYSLGGRDGFGKLYDYTKTQGCSLLTGLDIFSSSSGFPLSEVRAIDGSDALYRKRNDLAFRENTSDRLVARIGTEASSLGKAEVNTANYSQNTFFDMKLIDTQVLPDKFSALLSGYMGKTSDGVCIEDAGRVLYSSSRTDRETAKDTLHSVVRAVSDYGELIVEGGNLYSVFNAMLVSDMELDTFYKESGNYYSVPFVQAVYHGYNLYTGHPIDAGDPLYRYDMLRCIEFGAVPCYEWIYENTNIYCYSGYLQNDAVTEMVDFYNDATELFSALRDDTITSHYPVLTDSEGNSLTGVYCTGYSDGTDVYVNYTGRIVTTNGNIVIGPHSFVAVRE